MPNLDFRSLTYMDASVFLFVLQTLHSSLRFLDRIETRFSFLTIYKKYKFM